MTFIRPFLVWFSLGLIGVGFAVANADLSVLAGQPGIPDLPPIALRLLMALQPALLLALAITIGLTLSRRAGLNSVLTDRLRKKKPRRARLAYSVLLGFIGGAVVVATDTIILGQPAGKPLSHWLMALTYGGITEELLIRYGLMTLLFYGATVILAKPVSNRIGWIIIAIVALLFGLAHLPAMSLETALTPLIITRTIGFNAALAMIYGWSYWRRGLEAAMVAHIATHAAFYAATQITL